MLFRALLQGSQCPCNHFSFTFDSVIDEKVRANPEAAYEIEFLEALTADGVLPTLIEST